MNDGTKVYWRKWTCGVTVTLEITWEINIVVQGGEEYEDHEVYLDYLDGGRVIEYHVTTVCLTLYCSTTDDIRAAG